jgi:hypothetical protein
VLRSRSAAPAVLALLLAQIAWPAPARAQEGAREVIARCAREAPSQHSGLEQLAADCPGLAPALARLGLDESLAEGAAERLDARSLAHLVVLTRPTGRAAPDPARLAPVLRGLQNSDAPDSWWQRFKRWVTSLLTPRPGQAGPSWLDAWLERLTPGRLLRQVLVYGGLAAVVIAAAVVVVREVRASDLRLRGPRRRAPGGPVPDAAADAAEPQALDGVPFAERPVRLFRLVAARLTAAGRLPRLRSLTHRELRQRATLEDAEQRRVWQGLAQLAERQVYAPRSEPDSDAAQILAAAERLWVPRPPAPGDGA